MLARRSLLQNLAVVAMLSSLMAVPVASGASLGISKISHTPPVTISNEPPPECTGTGLTVMMPSADGVGELHTALSSASITYGLAPSVPCSVLAVLPSSLQDDFADFETRWYNWWQTQRCVTGLIFHFLITSDPRTHRCPHSPPPRFLFLTACHSPWTNISDAGCVYQHQIQRLVMGFDLLGPVYGGLWHPRKRVSQFYLEHG